MDKSPRVDVYDVLKMVYARLKEKYSVVDFHFLDSKAEVEAYRYDDGHHWGGVDLCYPHTFLARSKQEDGYVLLAHGTTFISNVGSYEADIIAISYPKKEESLEQQMGEVKSLIAEGKRFKNTLFYAFNFEGISHGPDGEFSVTPRHFRVRDMLKAKGVRHDGSHIAGPNLYRGNAQYKPESVDTLVSIAEEVLSLEALSS